MKQKYLIAVVIIGLVGSNVWLYFRVKTHLKDNQVYIGQRFVCTCTAANGLPSVCLVKHDKKNDVKFLEPHLLSMDGDPAKGALVLHCLAN